MRIPLPVTAQNTWSSKFELLGDKHYPGKPARAQISIVQGATESTVTLRRYDDDGVTVTDSQTMTVSKIVEVPCTGMYDIGVATGGFGSGTCLITLEQDRP